MHLHINGLSAKEIHEDMQATLTDKAPSYTMVKKWSAEFKRGRKSLEDDLRPGRPMTVSTKANFDKIHDMLLSDRRLTERYIAQEMGMSLERVHAISINDLEMAKVSA